MPTYLEYVKVDAGDGLPATQFPTRNGPADPLTGIDWHWTDAEQVPARYYGSVHGNTDADVPGVMRVIEDEEWQGLVDGWLNTLKREAVEQLAAYRYAIQTGGMTLDDGTRVLTTDEAIARQQIAADALADGRETVDYKAVDGWITLDAAALEAMRRQIRARTQDCFSAERTAAGQIAELATLYDVRVFNVAQAFDESMTESAPATPADA